MAAKCAMVKRSTGPRKSSQRQRSPLPKELVSQIARDSNLAEAQVEHALGQLIEFGHLKIVPGNGPEARPMLQFIIKAGRNANKP